MFVTVDSNQIAGIKRAIENTGRVLRKELQVAVNATAKKAKSIINREIRLELAAPASSVAKTIRASRMASNTELSATVEVKKTSRIPLRDFGARQTRKGVTARISKTRGRKLYEGAFQGPRPGLMNAKWRGRVFRRLGKSRNPIAQLYGPSSWGVFTVGKRQGPSVEQTEAELKKQIDRRIKFLNLKKAGTI